MIASLAILVDARFGMVAGRDEPLRVDPRFRPATPRSRSRSRRRSRCRDADGQLERVVDLRRQQRRRIARTRRLAGLRRIAATGRRPGRRGTSSTARPACSSPDSLDIVDLRLARAAADTCAVTVRVSRSRTTRTLSSGSTVPSKITSPRSSVLRAAEQIDVAARRIDRTVETDRALAERQLELAGRGAADLELVLDDLELVDRMIDRRDQPRLGRRFGAPSRRLSDRGLRRRTPCRAAAIASSSFAPPAVTIATCVLRNDDIAGQLPNRCREIDRDGRVDRRLERAHERDVASACRRCAASSARSPRARRCRSVDLALAELAIELRDLDPMIRDRRSRPRSRAACRAAATADSGRRGRSTCRSTSPVSGSKPFKFERRLIVPFAAETAPGRTR